jgi:hypothetical protein
MNGFACFVLCRCQKGYEGARCAEPSTSGLDELAIGLIAGLGTLLFLLLLVAIAACVKFSNRDRGPPRTEYFDGRTLNRTSSIK